MFDLVNDVESYPTFMQGCHKAEVLEQHGNVVIGKLSLGKAGISQTFVTRNVLDEPESIHMELVEGNFDKFDAQWDFLQLTDTACKVSLHMEFEFRTGLVDLALEALFNASSNSLVDALVKRAHQVYG